MALGVKSCSCPRHSDCDHLYQTPAWMSQKQCTVSLVRQTLRTPRLSMDEVLFSSVWNTIRSSLCEIAMYKLCTLRYPIMECFGRLGLQEAEVFIPSHDLCTPESGDMPRSAEDRIYDMDTMSDGSMSPDLSDMWHQGYPMSPQWQGQLELDSVSGDDNACRAMEHGMRDISITRESSLWILIRDSLFPPDVIRLRTAGRRWNNAELSGEFAALWFFFMTKNEATPTSPLPEWPSLCFDYRDNFGFTPTAIEFREWSDFSTGSAQSEKHPSSHVYRVSVLLSGPRRAQLGTDSSWLIVCTSWRTWNPGCACVCATLHAACIRGNVGLQCSVVRVGGFL